MQSGIDITVIICAHNSRRDYLERTLRALDVQTLSKARWELLLIDNASEKPLHTSYDLSWHVNGRHVHEKKLGLTQARIRGIQEAKAAVLVFVDDDNVLVPTYLSNALELSVSHDWVGAFGGDIVGEFEAKPEVWMEAMLPSLAIIPVEKDAWACGPGTMALGYAPCGAGMVVRREVAVHYLERLTDAPLRLNFDRKGTSLASAGDSDIALCACALGLAVGRFTQLKMTHLIAATRLKRDYLLRLAEEMAFSHTMLRYVWDGTMRSPTPSARVERIVEVYYSLKGRIRADKKNRFDEEVRQASERGIARAADILRGSNDLRSPA